MLHHSQNLLALVTTAALAALSTHPRGEAQLPPQEHLAITEITVVDVDAGRLLPNRTVLISDGRITAVADSRTTPVSAAARRIEGRGRFLIPGLIDTHVHLALAQDRDRLAAIGPLVAHGVTGVRDAGTGGQDEWLVALRDRIARGDILGPRLYVSGMVSRRSIARSGLADAATLARQLVDLGVDGLKIRDGLTNDDIRTVVAVAAKSKRPVYGHTYDAVSRERDEIYTLDAVQSGVVGTMHVMGMPQLGRRERPAPPPGPRFGDNWERWWLYHASWWLFTDRSAERVLIETMVARGAWLEPTLITEDWIGNAHTYRDSWARRRLPGSFERAHVGFPMPEGVDLQRYRDALARMKDFVRRFHDAGGVIIAGTDCLPACGYGLHDELRLLVSAGLSPAAALRAATVAAARVLGWHDRVGQIATGHLADLVVVDGNPLQDVGNAGRVHAVVANGRYIDRAALDQLVASAASDRGPR